MPSPKKTIVLGPLLPAVEAKVTKTGETLSQYVRRVVAADLRVEPPELPEGKPKKIRYAKTK